MLTQHELEEWYKRLNISVETQSLVNQIRSSEPTRRVQGRAGNVSGRYPSRKMGCTIQFESHKNEFAAILEFEYDPSVLEYYDQALPIKLKYQSNKGKPVNVTHTPDFFVIHQTSAGWVECKTEQGLIHLAETQSARYKREKPGLWHCPPGEEYAAAYGLSYKLKSSANIDWQYQRNVNFLEDYFRAQELEITNETITCFQSLVAAQPGITLASLLAFANQHGLAVDLIYIMIATSRLYIDLKTYILAEPERTQVYYDELASLQHSSKQNSTQFWQRKPAIEAGRQILWDGKLWSIVNIGDNDVWMRDETNNVISLTYTKIDELIRLKKIIITSTNGENNSQYEMARQQIASASPKDLEIANHRYRILSSYRSNDSILTSSVADSKNISDRTIQRWSAKYKSAEVEYGSGFIGLLPRIRKRGNRQQRMPEAVYELMNKYISEHYEDLRQPNRFSVWAKLKIECENKEIPVPTYRTFCREIKKQPIHKQTQKRQGKRAAYVSEEFYYELDRTTPRHGDRPFEIAHIDHTPLDIELVCSKTEKVLGRPWMTLMTDAFSRRFLGVYLTFDPPSYRSAMMVMRSCVSRFHRVPQIIVVDGSREFGGVYFETLLARYECTKKERPSGKARFGSVCERLLGVTQSRFIYNLTGNTQMTKSDLRNVTKSVNPKNLAAWTFEPFYDRLCEFVYEIQDTIDHPALGQSPREAFNIGVKQVGARKHKLIEDEEEFRILTMPSTTKGKAKVIPGRGVRINYIYYWCNAFRNGEIERSEVDVRYDPFDAGYAYAYIKNHWHQCISEYYHIFHDRSETELIIATTEMKKRRQNHEKRIPITANRLATFLKAVENDEALLIQRRKDFEVKEAAQRAKPVNAIPTYTSSSVKNYEETPASFSSELKTEKSIYDDLEIYEEYN